MRVFFTMQNNKNKLQIYYNPTSKQEQHGIAP